MNLSTISSVTRRSLLGAVLCVVMMFGTVAGSSISAYAQSNPSTISSKEKVSIIVDRELVAGQSFLLVKIVTPENAKVESFALSGPPRIVVDFVGLKLKKSEDLNAPKNGVIKQFRLGAHPDKLRVVIDLLTTDTPTYEWKAGARQAILRIAESGKAPPAAASAAAPTLPVVTKAPTISPTLPLLPTAQATPTRVPPSSTPTSLPTTKPTSVPTAPAPTEANKAITKPKLPEVEDEAGGTLLSDQADEKEIEAALEKEVAAASHAIASGTPLSDEELQEDDAAEDTEAEAPEEEEGIAAADETSPEPAQHGAPALGAVAAGAAAANIPSAAQSGGTKPSLTQALKPNVVPPTPITSFTVEKANFEYLEPGHHQAFKVLFNQPGAQAQVSKIDSTTYKIAVSSCGVSSLGLALPQYPPSDYAGLGMVGLKTDGDRLEITVSVQPGTRVITLMRDKEMWIKKQ